MSTALRRYIALSACLSLVSVAGCAQPPAAPTATSPVAVASGEAPTAPAAEAPAAQPAAPAAPAAIAADRAIAARVTFRGEPATGYAVKAYDAQSGALLPVGGEGLSVDTQSATTDRDGRFTLHLAGLAPGRAVRVVARMGAAAFETIVTGTGEAVGAGAPSAYRLFEEQTLPLDELTTALSRVARGVVRAAGLLQPQAAAQAMAKAVRDLAVLTPKLAAALKAQPSLANRAVEAEGPGDDHVSGLIEAAGAMRDANDAVAGLLAAIAKQAGDPAQRASLTTEQKAGLLEMVLVGTTLKSSLDEADQLVLINRRSGISLRADAPSLTVVTKIPRRSGGHPTAAPAEPPTLTAVSQAQGSVGTTLTLTGTHFWSTPEGNVVKFGGVEADEVLEATETTLKVKVPAGALSGDITVEVAGQPAPEGVAFEVVARGTILHSYSGYDTPFSLAFADDDTLYIAGLGETSVRTIRNGQVGTSYPMPGLTIGLLFDRTGALWVTTDHGTRRIVDGVVTTPPSGMDNLGTMTLDADGHVWASVSGTSDLLDITVDDQGGLSKQNVTMPFATNVLAVQGSTVWAGIRTQRTVVPVSNGVAGTPVDIYPNPTNGHPTGVTSMLGTPDGTLWVGGYSTDGYLNDTVVSRVVNGSYAGSASIVRFVEAFVASDDGAVWGTQRYLDRLTRFDPSSGQPGDSIHLPAGQPIAVAKDHAGNLWVGTINNGTLYQLAP